jgi:hypothetical protein
MAKTQRTYIQVVTDPMILVYPKFETPDIYVDPKTKVAGKPCYKTDAKAIEGKDEAMLKLQAFVLAELIKLFPDMDPKTRRRTLSNGDTKTVHWPFKVDKDGNTTLSAKTARTTKAGELMRVMMFDAKNQALPAGVYPSGGTVARLKLTLNAMPNDGGINFYIDQLQVLKLEESSFGKSAFEPTEGYAYDGGAAVAQEPEEEERSFSTDEADATKF